MSKLCLKKTIDLEMKICSLRVMGDLDHLGKKGSQQENHQQRLLKALEVQVQTSYRMSTQRLTDSERHHKHCTQKQATRKWDCKTF